MGYGQYTESAARLTKREILASAPGEWDRAWKSAHNEVTRRCPKDRKTIVRFFHTDILEWTCADPTGVQGWLRLSNGGYPTQSTHRQIRNALRRLLGVYAFVGADHCETSIGGGGPKGFNLGCTFTRTVLLYRDSNSKWSVREIDGVPTRGVDKALSEGQYV